jgi:adenylosuccinate lyase
MEFTPLYAISPVDGRYRKQSEPLSSYFSEYALIRYRVWVEVEYFIALVELPLPQLKEFPEAKIKALRDVYESF